VRQGRSPSWGCVPRGTAPGRLAANGASLSAFPALEDAPRFPGPPPCRIFLALVSDRNNCSLHAGGGQFFHILGHRQRHEDALRGGIQPVFPAIFGGVGPVRYPYAGEAGERNYFRGDGYFDIDSSLTKNWNIAERVNFKFSAEAYNITNSNRFDVSPAGLNPQLTQPGLGAYSTTLSTYRRMQFGVRLDF